jgi:UDP:flavonoid glycosyltransferase YjiC (YdhE family)
VPRFEYPRSDLQPSVHFIGPILPDPLRDFTPPAWWSDVTSAQVPVVVVTQGTIATNPEDLLLPTLRALADQPVLVVATGDNLGAVPDNARVAPFIPFAELMPHTDVLVTNGGYGGITIAMTNGVPVVASGISEDKAEVGNRVRAAGIGVSLKSARPEEAQIRAAVNAVLHEPRFREAARRIQADCATYDAPRLSAQLLGELARTRQPVLRGGSSTAVADQPLAVGAPQPVGSQPQNGGPHDLGQQ